MPSETLPSKLRRNLNICTQEGLCAVPWVFLAVPGNFIFAAMLTQLFELKSASYGFIASLPAWSNALQILLIPVVARFMNARDLTLGISWLNLGLWTMMLAFLPFLPAGEAQGVAKIFGVFFVLGSLSGALLGVGWTAWVQEYIPMRVRGTYFGKRNRACNMATIGFLLLAGILLEGRTEVLWPYQVLIAVAVILRFLSVLNMHRIESDAPTNQPLVHSGWFRQLRALRENKHLILFILFGAWNGFWFNVAGPFVPVYMYDHLGFTSFSFTILQILGTISGALTMPLWGRAMDRHGSIPIILVGLVAWELQNYIWAFITPDTAWLLYGAWVWGGMTAAGYLLGTFGLLLKLIGPESKASGVSFNLAATSVAAALGPLVAGSILGWAETNGENVVMVYRTGFFIKSTAVLASIALLIKIREPKVERSLDVLGAMRTLRQNLQIQTLAFIANMTFVRPGEDDEGKSPKSRGTR